MSEIFNPKIFTKTITLGNIIQVFILLISGISAYYGIISKFETRLIQLDARINQLDQVKIETKDLVMKNYAEFRQSQVELNKEIFKLTEAVNRLVTIEEFRQRTGKNEK